MKKKIFVILISLILQPITNFAVSIEELRSNPAKYAVVREQPEATTYLESPSIESLRYSPPYYTLSAKNYMVLYPYKVIVEGTIIANYDANHNLQSLCDKVRQDNQRNPRMSYDDSIKNLIHYLYQNTGMSIRMYNSIWYDFNGRILYTYPEINAYDKKEYHFTYDYGSPGYQLANFMFYKYYKEYFQLPLPANAPSD